ncbi:MAG: hypothetical protein ACK4ZM_00490 [bacterium]
MVIILSISIIFTLLAFAQTLIRFSDFYRFYPFWQGYYLADSFEVKFFSNYTNGEIIVNNVPFYSYESPQEIGKAKLTDSFVYGYTKINQTTNYYSSKVKVTYNNGKITEYKIFGKYTE